MVPCPPWEANYFYLTYIHTHTRAHIRAQKQTKTIFVRVPSRACTQRQTAWHHFRCPYCYGGQWVDLKPDMYFGYINTSAHQQRQEINKTIYVRGMRQFTDKQSSSHPRVADDKTHGEAVYQALPLSITEFRSDISNSG